VRRYGRAARTTIQVDFLPYLREIGRERRAGAARQRMTGRHAGEDHSGAVGLRPVAS
jgi:hypothetical protein